MTARDRLAALALAAVALEQEPTRPPAFRLYRGPDMDWNAPAKHAAQRMEHLAVRRDGTGRTA